MKTYTIYFNEPICHKYIGDKFNKDLKKWEYDVECQTKVLGSIRSGQETSFNDLSSIP